MIRLKIRLMHCGQMTNEVAAGLDFTTFYNKPV